MAPTDRLTRGLYDKYEVFSVEDPTVSVADCFVLRPESDPAARTALRAYAAATPNETLARDLVQWMDGLDRIYRQWEGTRDGSD